MFFSIFFPWCDPSEAFGILPRQQQGIAAAAQNPTLVASPS